MLSKIKYSLMSLMAIGLFAVPVLAFQGNANAQIEEGLCQGATLQFGDGADCDTVGGDETELNDLLADIINIISVIVGIVAVIMIIYGGFKYITSGGDSGNVTGAKNTILYAIVGLIIVALAQFIVKFVLNTSSGVVSG